MADEAKLPTTPQVEHFLEFATHLETALESGDEHFKLVPKKTGGTSAYALVQTDDGIAGALLPENSATSIVGEVSSFNISRALGFGELEQPGVKLQLRGKGLAAFRSMLENARYSGPKEQNRLAILKQIKACKEDGLACVYKEWGKVKPVEYSAIEAPGSPNGRLNEKDRFAVFLKASAPQPSANLVKLANGTATEKELAVELSNILVVDALAGQWDRFSGGNLHLLREGDHVHFAALDNGGATLTESMRYLNLFKQWVMRFDATTAERVAAMDALVTNGTPFLGFSDRDAFCHALGIDGKKDREAFFKRVHAVAAHVASSPGRF
jgi:hypothetical protein